MTNCERLLHVERIAAPSGLADLSSGWNLLAPTVPFLSYAWGSAWFQHYQAEAAELFTLAVRDAAGRLIGVAPWHRQTTIGRGRIVRFLGSGDVCADYVSLVSRPEDSEAVATAVADWLAGPGAGQWDLVELSGVRESDPAIGFLRDELAARGHNTTETVRWQGWRTELPESWDAFLESLSKSRRTALRTLIRKHVDSGRIVFRQAETGADVARAFDILVDLHQKRRGMLDQPGCFASPCFTAFHRDLANRLLPLGKLRFSWLEYDGTPIAIEYSFTGGDSIYNYQGGFDPDMAKLSPGTLMSALSLRAAFAEGYRYFDFLRGDEPYKASWNAVPSGLVELRIAGRRPTARVRHAAWQTGEAVRRWASERWSPSSRTSAACVETATGETISQKETV